ncbi:alpha/beta hydrolase family protein [Acetobacter oeni]|nr:lipase family protein [Acetobacter oeni]MBB3883924.1 pimeloyl-ACP methyl ester carboxylesterase [Acetobacter oeni]
MADSTESGVTRTQKPAGVAMYCRVKRPGWMLSLCLNSLFAFTVSAQAGDDLPTSLPEARAMEAQDALPVTAFYTAPAAGDITPGKLIRQEPGTDYVLPSGIKAWRILYHSLDAARHDVTTSAFVLIPEGTPPKGGWPVVAWAHGTSGVAQPCAPSRMKDLYYGDEGLFEFPKAGLAVVATDYHGLATPGPHQYMNKLAQAYDVIYSVRAVREAFPGLSHDWVVDGHSQGGMASWSVAEMEQQIDDPHYRGAVSVSGTVDMLDFIRPAPAEGGAPFYLPMVAFGLRARYPEYKPQSMLNHAGMAHYNEIATSGCWFTGYAALYGKTENQITKSNWTRNLAVQAMLWENAIGNQSVRGPLLVITGGGDTSVPPGGVRSTARKACNNGIRLAFRFYPGLDHDPTMTNSVKDQISWIKARLADEPFQSDCGHF